MKYVFDRDEKLCHDACVKVTSEFWHKRSQGQPWSEFYASENTFEDQKEEDLDAMSESACAKKSFEYLLEDLAGEIVKDMYAGDEEHDMLDLAINSDLFTYQRQETRLRRSQYHRPATIVDNLPELERLVRANMLEMSSCNNNPLSLNDQRECDHEIMVKKHFDDAVDTLEPQCTNYGACMYQLKSTVAEQAFQLYLEECVLDSINVMMNNDTTLQE